MKKISIVFFSIFINSFSFVNSQPTYYVTEETCTYMSKLHGKKLLLHADSGGINKITEKYGYELTSFVNLPDSIKLIFVEYLLRYKEDTALCCLDVIGRSYNGFEGCGSSPKAKRFNIQIDALYMINRLCWPSFTEVYSCYTALYDKKIKKIINNDFQKIKIVFSMYDKWFEECKAKKKISAYFPFNDGRYVWYGGKQSLFPNK